jgi:ribokinase
MLGCVGDDAHGDILQAALMEEGIDCCALAISKAQPTGLAMIVVEQASQNTIVVVGGSNDEMKPSVVQQNRELLQEADVVVCQLEIPLDTVRVALQIAKDAGKITVLNPAPAEDALPEDLYTLVDWLIPNELEASVLAGVPTRTNEEVERAARILLERGTRNVLITRGEKGVTWIKRDTNGSTISRFFLAKKVAAVDTTAAGDTFVGGFVAALSNGLSESKAIQLGQAAAAVAVTREGAQRSIPRLADIQDIGD